MSKHLSQSIDEETRILPAEHPKDLEEKSEIIFYGLVPEPLLASPFNLGSFSRFSRYRVKKMVFGMNHCLLQFIGTPHRNELAVFGSNEYGQLGLDYIYYTSLQEKVEGKNYYPEIVLQKFKLGDTNTTDYEILDITTSESYSLILVKFDDVLKYGKNNMVFRLGFKEEEMVKYMENKEGKMGEDLALKTIHIENLKYEKYAPIVQIYSFEERIILVAEDNTILVKGSNFTLEILDKYKVVVDKNIFENIIGTRCDTYADEEGHVNNGNDLNSNIKTKRLKIKYICLGKNHCLFYMEDKSIWALGDNEYGELGLEEGGEMIKFVKIPKKITFFEEKNLQVLKITAGARHTLVLASNNKVYAFGDNSEGQCSGYSQYYTNPQKVKIPGKEKIVEVYAGYNHSVAFSNRGEVYTWGDTSSGKLGYNSGLSTQNIPKAIKYLNSKNISNIFVGPMTTAIITATYDYSLLKGFLINAPSGTYNTITDQFNK